MTRTDDVASVHKAISEHDLVEMAVLRKILPADVFEEGAQLALATQALQNASDYRKADALVYLAQHKPGLTESNARLALSDDEILEYREILLGGIS